jgi:hypothetical protein
LGFVAIEQKRFDESLGFLKRAEDALDGIAHDPQCVDVVVLIDSARQTIARRLSERGEPEAGRHVLESNVGMRDRLSEHAGGSAAIALLAALATAEQAPDHSMIATLRTAIDKFPDKERLPETLEVRLGGWIAQDVNPYPAGGASSDKSMGRLDPDAHAVAVIRALESRCGALGDAPALFPTAALGVAYIAANRGAAERKAGRLDDARYTALCLSAFAKTLVRRDPSELHFHLLLSEAYTQESKNAWRVPDFPAIDEALRKALGEARTALRLDPRNALARLKVSTVRDKLLGLMSERPSSR